MSATLISERFGQLLQILKKQTEQQKSFLILPLNAFRLSGEEQIGIHF